MNLAEGFLCLGDLSRVHQLYRAFANMHASGPWYLNRPFHAACPVNNSFNLDLFIECHLGHRLHTCKSRVHLGPLAHGHAVGL